jgi:hypothetical protein
MKPLNIVIGIFIYTKINSSKTMKWRHLDIDKGIKLKEIYYIEQSINFTKECLNLWTFKKNNSVIGIVSSRYLFRNEKVYSCKITAYMTTKEEFSKDEIFEITTNIAEYLIKIYNLFDIKCCDIKEYTYRISKSSIYAPEICRANEMIKDKDAYLSEVIEKTKDVIQHELFSRFNRGEYFAYISEYRYDSGLSNIKPSITVSLEEKRRISQSEFDKFKEKVEEIADITKKPIFLWGFIKDIDRRISEIHKRWDIDL